MKVFESLKQFFKPQDVTVGFPDSPFIVIDREGAIHKLKLDERAADAGKANQPPSDAAEFDSIETAIIGDMSEYLNRAQIDAANNQSVYGQRLAELALLRELSSITGASQTALGDYQAAVTIWRNKLANIADAIRDSYQELSTFKTEHRLGRPAHGAALPIYTWAVVLGSWVVESVINTAFLRVNDQYGWVGGFIAALIVAAVNVGLSALVGRYWWGYIFHRSYLRRTLATLGCGAWLAGIGVWNLLAAHFRDAKSGGFEHPETQALASFLNDTFSLGSIYSYGLLAMGLAFALISASAAFRMDDPYPGYGPIYRRHEDRCDDYAEEVEEALSELREIRDSGIKGARDIRDQLNAQFAERGQIIAARETHRLRYDEHLDYLETITNSLLDHYRSANRTARTTSPPPHFSERWKLKRSPLPVLPPEPSIETEVQAAQRSLDQAIETIGQAYSNAIKSFASLDDIKRTLANG